MAKELTELEKLDAGLPYDVNDPAVDARKLHAVKGCQALEALDPTDRAGKEAAIRALFGQVGRNSNVLNGFNCDNGSNITVGDEFLANYNVTILDIAPVTMGDYVWIGPGTMISTVNHPLTPKGRRQHLGIAKPVTIGNDVVVAAGAVVTKDIPDNTLVGGVPAKKIRDLENDL